MSIWCSTKSVNGIRYGQVVYPWEEDERVEITFAYVPDYVYDPHGMGLKVLPYLRLGIRSEDEEADTAVVTEAQARALVVQLEKWLATPKRRIRRRRKPKLSVSDSGDT